MLFYMNGGIYMAKIFFIGAGSMAEALIQGWIKNEVVEPQDIIVSNRSNTARLEELQQTYQVDLLQSYEQLQEATIIVLAMKPKDVYAAMETIAPFIPKQTAVLTLLAGISIDTIENGLSKRPIARAMPNTSATIGLSATGVAFNEHMDAERKLLILTLLKAVGTVVEVEEDKIHAITALSGSGPAYIYYLMEAFELVGEQLGLSTQTVRSIMTQTIAGSAAMLQHVKEEPARLRQKVTSPGGTTEAGIKALNEHAFFETIAACVKSAETRSRQLAKEQ